MACKNGGFRVLRLAAVVAAMCILLTVTALATDPEFREFTFGVTNLGTSDVDPAVTEQQDVDLPGEDIPEAPAMTFRTSGTVEGVTVHYMELKPDASYTVRHGMLMDQDSFIRITEDYELVAAQMDMMEISLEKNGREYTKTFRYVDTENGVLSEYKSVFQKNANGEILLNASAEGSHQWPVYVNLETGEYRDALPQFTEDDFEGRVAYAEPLRGGILLSTVVNDGVVVNGNSVSYNMLYWIGAGAAEAQVMALPEDCDMWYCENDGLYCKNADGSLYVLGEDFQFRLVSDYQTVDDLSNGLLTVMTEDKKLAIVDILTGDTYVLDDITLKNVEEIDETMGYNAIRYDSGSTIALVQTELRTEEKRVALVKLGILDTESRTLKLLEIENGYDGYRVGWLDENRLAVIYKNGERQYLCIYEFE